MEHKNDFITRVMELYQKKRSTGLSESGARSFDLLMLRNELSMSESEFNAEIHNHVRSGELILNDHSVLLSTRLTGTLNEE